MAAVAYFKFYCRCGTYLFRNCEAGITALRDIDNKNDIKEIQHTIWESKS